MCRLFGSFNQKSFTGYKVALKIRGRYYSPYTGVEYTPGPVPVIKRIIKSNCSHWCADVLSSHFRSSYTGYTAVFVSKDKAVSHYDDFKDQGEPVVLIKMVLTGDLMVGTFSNDDVIAGKRIKSMKEV